MAAPDVGRNAGAHQIDNQHRGLLGGSLCWAGVRRVAVRPYALNSTRLAPAEPTDVAVMVMALMPSTAGDECHGDLSTVEGECSVNCFVVQSNQQLTESLDSSIELPDQRVGVGRAVACPGHRFIGIDHRYQRIVLTDSLLDEPTVKGHRFPQMPQILQRRPDIGCRPAPDPLLRDQADAASDRLGQRG